MEHCVTRTAERMKMLFGVNTPWGHGTLLHGVLGEGDSMQLSPNYFGLLLSLFSYKMKIPQFPVFVTQIIIWGLTILRRNCRILQVLSVQSVLETQNTTIIRHNFTKTDQLPEWQRRSVITSNKNGC